MKKKYTSLYSLLLKGMMFSLLMLGNDALGQFTIASDNAGNYGGNWNSNQGTGFGTWTYIANGGSGGFAGRFIGNPSSAGISGMNSSSFALFANPNVNGNESKAFRSFSGGALQFGDTFSFQMGMNFDSNNGNGFKGIDLRSSTAVVLNFNMGNSATITWGRPGAGTGGNLFTTYGTQAMNFQITKVGVNQYRIVATPRAGSTNFDETHTLAGEISAFEFYAGRLDPGDQRQPYYNNLTITNSGVFAIATGTETYSRSLSGSGNLSKSGNGTLQLTGNNTYTGTTTVTGGTLQLNATSGNTLGNSAVTVNGGTLRVSTNQTIANLTLSAGGLTIDSGATLTLSGNVTIPNGFTITNNGTLVIEGTLTDNRASKTYTGTVRYAANSGTQTVVGAAYNNLELNGNSTKTLNANSTVDGNLSLNAGTFDLGAFTINRASSGGILTIAANTTLTIGSTNSFPSNYATHSVASSSTVNYNGTNQTIAPLSGSAQYGNVILSGSGNKVLGGNVAIANDLTVQTGVALTVASGQNLTVTDQLINSGGTVTLENNANLIQSGTTNTNSGAITVNRDSSSLMRLDYTLWSAPVAAQNLLTFSPLTVANRFYTYNPSTNQYNTVTPSTTDFATGVGYLIRMPDNHPTTPTVWNGQFSGVPNNGNVSISVTNNTYNAVGNPYPSTIDADDFINDNSLTEALYFWRKTNGAAGSAYATYTLAGGAGTGGSGSSAQVPNGIIQVGQGFIARSTSTSLVFNNGMRVADNANQFFRSASSIEQNRIRVQTTGPDDFYGEVLVNYMTGATNGVDAALDGKYINDSEDALFTILETEPYVIQARALPFDVSDIVPLGFKTTQNGTFTFEMTQNDGIFASDYQVYLNDKQLNIVHPFAEGAYSFVSNAGSFTERFELIFEEGALSLNNPKGNKEDVIVFQQNGNWQVQSLNTPLQSVEVIDITGKQLLLKTGLTLNQESIFVSVNAPQVLLVKIGLQNGQTLLKKINLN